jgi:hypothetical protein
VFLALSNALGTNREHELSGSSAALQTGVSFSDISQGVSRIDQQLQLPCLQHRENGVSQGDQLFVCQAPVALKT